MESKIYVNYFGLNMGHPKYKFEMTFNIPSDWDEEEYIEEVLRSICGNEVYDTQIEWDFAEEVF